MVSRIAFAAFIGSLFLFGQHLADTSGSLPFTLARNCPPLRSSCKVAILQWLSFVLPVTATERFWRRTYPRKASILRRTPNPDSHPLRGIAARPGKNSDACRESPPRNSRMKERRKLGRPQRYRSYFQWRFQLERLPSFSHPEEKASIQNAAMDGPRES